MSLPKLLRQSRFLFVSPWLLAAAIGILTLIVVVFAVNNLQREKKLMAENLRHKGVALARFVGASTRAATMMGQLNARQVQQLIEEASVDDDIVYIGVVDEKGRFLAHSDPAMVGHVLKDDMGGLRRLAGGDRARVVSAEVGGETVEVFEVVSPFWPFRPGLGRLLRQGRPGGKAMIRPFAAARQPRCRADGAPLDLSGAESGDWCSALVRPERTGLFILVGLDMSEQEALVRQGRFHLLAMSLVLLLVGIGGWLSLFVLQGYRLSQEALKQVQAFASLLIGRLPVGIIAVDRGGVMQTFNPAAAAMLGESADEAVGRRPAEVLPPLVAEFFDNPADSEEWLHREVEIMGDDLQPLILRGSSVPIVEEGVEGAAGRVVLLHDISELKSLEGKIRRHEQLVALGKMAAGVAHEVRNPLSSIKGFATLLGAKFPVGSQEHASARLMVNEVERLNRSITELLDYARPLPLNLAPVELGEAIDNSLKLIRADAEVLGVKVTSTVSPLLPPVIADRDRLLQVFLNLFLNALQAMEGGGTLVVEAGPGDAAGWVAVKVRDNGRGIPAAELQRVFDPYFTTKPSGTGLGLAMVLKIVDEHHGTVRVASREGEGTTVTLSLPIMQ